MPARPPRGFSPSGDFLHRPLGAGVDLFVHPARRFRTVLVRCCLMQPLDADSASALALAGSVLKQGSSDHPARRDLYGALDHLYGADLEVDAVRVGEAQVLEAELSLPSERATGGRGSLARALGLLAEVLGRPLKEGRGFPPRRLLQERINLRDAMAAVMDHKPSYAVQRCLTLACKREPYRTGRYGTPEALARHTPEGLWRRWRSALAGLPMAVYAVGDLDPSETADHIASRLLPLRGGPPSPPPRGGFRRAFPAVPLRHTERGRVSQARLCLAFRANTAWGERGFSALVLAVSVLGGGSHGKLFRELRERASLAYDAQASLERTKGLLVVSAGVAPAGLERAETILLDQVAAVRAGRITRREWADSRASLLNRVRTTVDSAGRMVSLHLEGWINRAPRSCREILSRIRSATPAEAAEAASRWAHAATYRLTAPGRRA